MKVSELKQRLDVLPPEMEIMVVCNSSLGPQSIESGPNVYTISQQDEDDLADCEGRVGEQVVTIGIR